MQYLEKHDDEQPAMDGRVYNIDEIGYGVAVTGLQPSCYSIELKYRTREMASCK